eukprot:5289286-Prymnesium_polylepis.1
MTTELKAVGSSVCESAAPAPAPRRARPAPTDRTAPCRAVPCRAPPPPSSFRLYGFELRFFESKARALTSRA